MPMIGGIYVSGPKARPGYGDILGSAAEAAYGQVRYGLPYQAQKLAGGLSAEDEAFYQRGLAETSAAASRAAPATVGDLTGGKVGIARFIGENLVSSLPYMVGAGVGGIAGGLVAGPGGAIAGAIAGGVPQFSGSNVARAVEEEGGLSQAAAGRALAVAPLQSASDIAVARFLPGVGKVFGDLAATQSGGFLRRTAASVLKAGGTEAITEAAQQGAERYSAGLSLTGPDAAAEYVNAAVTAFAVGGALGAGGGFRRTNAIAKAPEAVTNQDMIELADKALDGSLRVGQPRAPTLALPSPEAFAPPIVVGQGGEAVTPQQAQDIRAAPGLLDPQDPAELAARAPERQAAAEELAQNAVDVGLAPMRRDANALQQIEAIQNGTVNAPPSALAASPAPAPAAPANLLGETSLAGQRVGLPPVAFDPNPIAATPDRLLADQSLEVIQAATKSKRADPTLVADADAEISRRRLEAVGGAELTAPFEQRLGELTDGLKGSFVSKLTAENPRELVEKVYTEAFENANTASSVRKLAQRMGLLDENLDPTELANSIETERTAANIAANQPAPVLEPTGTPVGVATTEAVAPIAAPVSIEPTVADPAYASQWEELTKAAGINRNAAGLKAAGLDTAPANEQVAREQVLRAIGKDSTSAAVAQTEKLARKMGIITDDDAMDITPLGVKTYLGSVDAREDIVTAGTAQGYAPATPEGTAFQQGVQSLLGGQQAAQTSLEDMAAYQAGKVWAQDFIDNPATTASASNALLYRKGSTEERERAAKEGPRKVQSAISPAEVQRKALNQLLNNAAIDTMPDTSVAAIRREIAAGADAAQVGQLIEDVQGGKVLFKQSEPTQLSPGPVRGQPVFREMNENRLPKVERKGRADARAETSAAVQAYDLRSRIDQLVEEGRLTKAQSAKLHDQIDQGKNMAAQVVLRSKETGRAAQSLYIGEGGVFGALDTRLEAGLTGKTFAEAVDYLRENAPSLYHRTVMDRIATMAAQIEKAGGHKLELVIARTDDQVPTVMLDPNVRAYTQISRQPPTATVYLKGSQMGADSGMNYQLAMHEMLHAVTMQAIESTETRDAARATPLGKAVGDLNDLALTIRRHLNDRLDNAPRLELKPFELAAALDEHNAFSDPHEILAWGMTNPEMQRYLQTIEYKPRQSVFQRLVSLVRDLLGLDGKYDTALTELMRVSEQIMGATATDLQPVFERNGATGMAALGAPARSMGRTVDTTAEAIAPVIQRLDTLTGDQDWRGMGRTARKVLFGWLSTNMLNRTYQDRAGLLHSEAQDSRSAIQGRFSTMGQNARVLIDQLRASNPKQVKIVQGLMEAATVNKLDPARDFAEHEHLADNFAAAEAARDNPDVERLRVLHAEMVKTRNDLARGDGLGMRVFNEARTFNEVENLARMSADLHATVAFDPELKMGVEGAAVNPLIEFMRQPELATNADVRDYFQRTLNDQLAKATAFVTRKKGESLTEADAAAMKAHLSRIELQVQATYTALGGMKQAPYFHLGRFGNEYATAVMTSEKGVATPEAQAAVAKAFDDAGFNDVRLTTANGRPRIAMRFETAGEREQFERIARELQEAGYIENNSIEGGPRESSNNYGAPGVLPAAIQKYIASIEQSPMFIPAEDASPQERTALAKHRDNTVRMAVDAWLDQQPDTSISKVLAKRKTVAGYSTDMFRSFYHRASVGSSNIANTATRPLFNDSYVAARQDIADARRVPGKLAADATPEEQAFHAKLVEDHENVTLKTDLLNERLRREAVAPVNDIADMFSTTRSVTHAFFLGLSPAYAAINMSQLGVTALPELAKQHGYAKSFSAMRAAAPVAFRIMKAAFAEAQTQGAKHRADITLNETVLQKAGLTKQQADFVRHMIATSKIDIGSAARSFGQLAQGGDSKLDVGLKYASALGLYTETYSRLITALSAQKLHGGATIDAAKYAGQVVSDSMFDYQSTNTARQLGRQGVLGPVTPIVTQFMSYTTQITEKLYSEILGSLAKQRPGETVESAKERRAESRRFMLGHLTAVTALAGTLGMPFAAAIAGVIERIVDAADDDDDPYDATASWRSFLADALGKDVAEVVSRGVPRAFGFDISGRTGEADLIPFTKLMTDRRTWKESVTDTLGQMTGATGSMALGFATAGEKLGNGDPLGALVEAMPIGFKAPLKAGQMWANGEYRDTRGTKLPITPGARDIIVQLLGFTPSQRAEYSEARGDQQARRADVVRAAAVLRSQLSRARLDGDGERFAALQQDATKFDADNPAYAVLPTLQASIERASRQRATAVRLKTPLGVKMEDVAGQRLTRYANTGY